MKTTLGTRTKNIVVVIRKNKEIDVNDLRFYLDNNFTSYAFICHKNDISTKGEVEGLHYHIVAIAPNPKRLSSFLNEICDILKFDNPFGVEIDKMRSLESSIQYLIHKNDLDKTQHDKSEIITNFSNSELDILLSTDVDVMTFDNIVSICKSSNTILDVIESIGLSRYHIYRPTIRDIFEQIKKSQYLEDIKNVD